MSETAIGLQSHKLERGNGTYQSLAKWGITSCIVTHELGGNGDEMIFTIPAGIDEGPAFTAFEKLSLLDPTDTRRFKGRLVAWAPTGDAQSEVHTYTVAGAWILLQDYTFEQLNKFPEDPDDITSALIEERSSRVILHRNPLDGTKLSLQAQAEAVLEDAIAQGADLTHNLGDIPDDVQAPEDQVLDLRHADALRRTMHWAPHIGWRFNYTGTNPQIEFRNTTAPNPSVPGGDAGFGHRTLDLSGNGDAIRWSGRPRWDLLVPKFTIVYLGENQASDGAGNTKKWRTYHKDISTVSNGGVGALSSTVTLRGMIWDGTTYTAPEERPADGLAAVMHRAYSRTFYELEWTQQAEEVDWTIAVGQQWGVSGASAGFSGAEAVCQKVVRNIGEGTTAVSCGPPSSLGLSDRLALLFANRMRGLSNAAGESQYGFEDPNAEPHTEEEAEPVRIVGFLEDAGSLEPKIIEIPGATIIPP